MTTVGDLRASGIKLDPPTSYVSTLPWPFIQEHRGAKNLSHSARERARGCRSYHVVHTSWAAWKWIWLADLQKTPPAPVHLYSNLAALIGFTSYSQVSARSLNPYPTSRVPIVACKMPRHSKYVLFGEFKSLQELLQAFDRSNGHAEIWKLPPRPQSTTSALLRQPRTSTESLPTAGRSGAKSVPTSRLIGAGAFPRSLAQAQRPSAQANA